MRGRRRLLVSLAVALVGCGETQAREVNPDAYEVLAFTSSNCPACKRDKPALERLRKRGVPIRYVDAQRSPELVKRYKVKSFPTYVVLKSGVEFARYTLLPALIKLVKLVWWALLL